MLARAKNVVLWRAIAEEISARIEARELAPGQRLPTEHEYAESFGVNRHTVRRALAELQARGLIEVTQGRGSFVRRPLVAYPVSRNGALDEVLSFRREPAAPGRDAAFRYDRADAEVARALDMRAGDQVIAVENTGYAGDQPVALSTRYVALSSNTRCPQMLDAIRGGSSVDEMFADCGCERMRLRSTKVRARMATPREMAALDLPRHAPLLVADSVIEDADGHALTFDRVLFASDRLEIVFEPEGGAREPETRGAKPVR